VTAPLISTGTPYVPPVLTICTSWRAPLEVVGIGAADVELAVGCWELVPSLESCCSNDLDPKLVSGAP
jgi:hypothetical protein